MKAILAYKMTILTITVISSFVAFNGCSNKDNIKHSVNNVMSGTEKSQTIKNENYKSGYQERYPDYY